MFSPAFICTPSTHPARMMHHASAAQKAMCHIVSATGYGKPAKSGGNRVMHTAGEGTGWQLPALGGCKRCGRFYISSQRGSALTAIGKEPFVVEDDPRAQGDPQEHVSARRSAPSQQQGRRGGKSGGSSGGGGSSSGGSRERRLLICRHLYHTTNRMQHHLAQQLLPESVRRAAASTKKPPGPALPIGDCYANPELPILRGNDAGHSAGTERSSRPNK